MKIVNLPLWQMGDCGKTKRRSDNRGGSCEPINMYVYKITYYIICYII